MTYEALPSDTFNKDVGEIRDKILKERLLKVIERIKENPKSGKPLHGKFNRFGIYIGKYRLVYDVLDAEKRIILIRFRHRDKIYKNIYCLII